MQANWVWLVLFIGLICISLGGWTMSAAWGQEKGVKVEKVPYGGWENCFRMSNGIIELIVTQDVGPRIIRFGFVGEENEFTEYKDQLGKTGGDEWRIYGGHRLWHAPEVKPRTYFPDNFPVEIKQEGETLYVVQPVETTTGIQKEMDITMSPDQPYVKIVHRLRNQGQWAIELAPWVLTVMAQKGRVIIPQAPYAPHPEALLPVRPVALWAYTDMKDPRWIWGTKYIVLRQDPEATEPQKIGVGVKEGWSAYWRAGHLFLKLFEYKEGATYPDFGCSVETFTNAEMIELETLGPLTKLEPGASVEHTEHIFLFKGVNITDDEATIDREVLPKVEAAREMVQN